MMKKFFNIKIITKNLKIISTNGFNKNYSTENLNETKEYIKIVYEKERSDLATKKNKEMIKIEELRAIIRQISENKEEIEQATLLKQRRAELFDHIIKFGNYDLIYKNLYRDTERFDKILEEYKLN
jgi:esterase/lipase